MQLWQTREESIGQYVFAMEVATLAKQLATEQYWRR
jgi:hypothetical protein